MQDLLKFITCGSVDDGKSTLIGHMLYDSKLIFSDQEESLKLESQVGSNDGNLDYSLLLDGLMAEREQGITIDVAYRYFTTNNRSFIVADTPGHEEYTRNMAVGASFADLAVILVDSSKGILTQTKRHTRICALMGIKHVVYAVNKIDIVDYSHSTYDQICLDIQKICLEYNFKSVFTIPVSATIGDNLTTKSTKTPWYEGPTLLEYLENIDVNTADKDSGSILPIQRVCRPNREFRGFQGEIILGSFKKGDEITVLPSEEKAHIKAVYNLDKETDEASKGQAVTVSLDKEIDVSRGSVILKDTDLYKGKLFRAKILWMDDKKLVAGKNYSIKLSTAESLATVMNIKHKIDVNEGSKVYTDKVYKNEIAVIDLACKDVMIYNKFKNVKEMGSFILIDNVTHQTAACGVIEHNLRRDENIIYQKMDITRDLRSAQKNQKPKTIWFTGLSGSGKSTLANALEKRLFADGKHTMSLDGDNIRLGLNKNLGFKEQDRIENIRRIAEVAKLLNDAGVIAITSFISPFLSDRENAKSIIGRENFIEIYVSTPLEECEKRDVKGLYKKARAGEIPNFSGISSPYEPPKEPDLTIDTSKVSLEDAVELIYKKISDSI
ncbi:MAG: adenylyl-sulfate kinase [Lachnospiraceae bacterium]|nr:adenylyl-sulfate kinase [Lachnospiraceae bacterium]